MSALVLQNNALWYIFEDFTASILLSACFLIYVIRNQFSNHPTHDNKIANELSARMTEINGILTAEIEKNKTRDGSITAEIERLLTDVYKKLSAEVNTKIANELPARLSEINSTFTAELGRINNELNGKLTAEIKKINSRDADYASEAQRILSIVNNIEEACRNDFASVNASIEALQNGLIQCYTNNRRIQPVETDQVSNHSEASNRSHASGSSSGSEPMSFKGISLTIWTQFKQIFDKIKAEKRFNLEEMCLHVAMEIRELGGNIKKVTVQGFYERNIKKKDGYISTLDDIGLWIDSKLNVNNNANSANNNAE